MPFDLTSRRTGEDSTYLVTTGWGASYQVRKEFFADGPSLFTWTVRLLDADGHDGGYLRFIERNTKDAALLWIASQNPVILAAVAERDALPEHRRFILDWAQQIVGADAVVTAVTGFEHRHTEHVEGWDNGQYDSASCTPPNYTLRITVRAHYAFTARNSTLAGHPYAFHNVEIQDESMLAEVTALLTRLTFG